MKTIKNITLLLLLLLLNSCAQNENIEDYPLFGSHPNYMLHSLFFSFQDTSGNDLITGIGFDEGFHPGHQWEGLTGGLVKRNLYTLEFIYPDISMDIFACHNRLAERYPDRFERIYPSMWLRKNNHYLGTIFGFYLPDDGYDRLELWFTSARVYYDLIIPPPEWIIARLSSPHIFGDNEKRDIVTHWRLLADDLITLYCYRIEFEGREFFPDKFSTRRDGQINAGIVTIVMGDD